MSLLLKEEELPNLPTKDTEHKAIEYVSLVFDGMDKIDAFKETFPARYDRLAKKATADRRNIKATVMSAINMYERGKYVASLYSMANEQYYARFVNKRTKLLEKLYDIAMSDDEKMSHRLVASKTFLGSIPEPKQEIVHKVEVDVKDEFRRKLEERQKMLYSIANNEDIEEAIVVDEVVEDE
jgi:hypothetical protein